MFRTVSTGVVAAACASIVFTAPLMMMGAVPAVRGVPWVSAICACAALHIVLRRMWAARPSPAWRPWALRFCVVAVVEGLLWGWAPIGLVDGTRYDQRLIVLLAAYGIAAGAVAAFSPYLPAFWCLFLPATLPGAVVNLASGEGDHLTMGLLAAVFVLGMGALGRRANAEFNGALRLRFEVDELAEAFRRQKDLAEAANLAKSQFLAAASHDLRQPVHALSLTVGALQMLHMTPDARAMVGDIEASVATLDLLFTSLLDISRLDAAAVEPEPDDFALQPTLDRVCQAFLPEARTKGLSLRLVRCSLAVRTDPVLLERILRNLVGNAVRHTTAGRVLVGCRRIGGRVQVEVWDTGPGIAVAMQERVFEEFVQVGNQARRSDAGLGLGLAIVRRLTRLLGIEMSMRSTVGAGTRFTLRLDRAEPPRSRPLEPAPARSAAKFILVIEDEPAIVRAMTALLTGWGHDVVAATSGAEMLQRLAACPTRPDLLICDYRLGDGIDGIATIARLQSEYNDDLPAILITGDTGPDRLAEAVASRLPLIHKPVEHGRLRREIDRVLASEAAMDRAGPALLPPGFD